MHDLLADGALRQAQDKLPQVGPTGPQPACRQVYRFEILQQDSDAIGAGPLVLEDGARPEPVQQH